MDVQDLLPFIASVAVGVFVFTLLVKKLSRRKPATPKEETAAKEEPLPVAEVRDYVLSEIGKYNGSDPTLPIIIGVGGRVFDVTKGRKSYQVGGAYNLFAGRDATVSLAKMNFEPQNLDADASGLSSEEKFNVQTWMTSFESRGYPNLGCLIRDK